MAYLKCEHTTLACYVVCVFVFPSREMNCGGGVAPKLNGSVVARVNVLVSREEGRE